MPATAVLKGGKVKGEGRVISINAKYGFLAAQGINSKVFIIPSSLKVDAPFPALTDELHIDDLVTFEASEQVERNGAKYLAVDGSVKLKQRGRDVMVEGDGKIVRLDVVRGCFGFVDSVKVGSVFFNISAVRPATTDVTKVLKLGQKVKFRALPNSEQPNCKWRASVVCAFNKAHEYLIPTTNNVVTTTSYNNNTNSTAPVTNGSAACSPQINGTNTSSNNNNQIQDKNVDPQGASTTNSSSFSQVAKVKKVIGPDTKHNQRPRKVNNGNNNADIHGAGAENDGGSSRSGSVGGSARPRLATNGGISTSAENLHNFTSNNGSSCSVVVVRSIDTNGFTDPSNHCPNFNVDSRQQNGTRSPATTNNAVSNNNINNNNNNCSSASKHSWGWPSVDHQSLNPAAMWDLYLEQQQKALNQTYNPFSVYPGVGKDCCCCCMGHALPCSNSASCCSDVCDRPISSGCREGGGPRNNDQHQHHHQFTPYGYGRGGGATTISSDSPLLLAAGGGGASDDDQVGRLAHQINGWSAVLDESTTDRDSRFIDGHK